MTASSRFSKAPGVEELAREEQRWHPAGPGRQISWPQDTDGWGEDRLWILNALKHWMWGVAHGYEGRRMLAGDLRPVFGVKSAGTVSSWIAQGGVRGDEGLKYCETVRERAGCTASCESGYGDLAELRKRYARARHHSEEQKRAARQRSRRRTVVPAPLKLTPREIDRRLSVLAEAREGALRSLETVTVNQFGPAGDRVTLAQVRVERTAERQMLKHIERQLNGAAAGQAAALVGEPGVGKSCSLWGVHRTLSRREDICLVLLSATSLLAGPGGPADLRPHELPALLHEHRGRTSGVRRPLVLLLDTADLLLHQPETANDFVELITDLRSAGTAVALACRRGEAGLLKQSWDTARGPGAYASLLSDILLDLYDTGTDDDRRGGWAPGSELARAVDAYAKAYAPRRTEGSLPQMRRALADASARGLPLGELIRHPLHLRMVFDLYAPEGPSGSDLDVAGLFHDFWVRRVDRDMRHSTPAPGTEPGEQTMPLGPVAAEIGLVTLREGTIELRQEAVRDLVASRLGLSGQEAAHSIGVLRRRGVLSEPFAGRLRFHHQAIGEYAAGRGLADSPAGLDAAVRRIAEHPQDLYLAEAARHAFHHSDRTRAHRATHWYPLLAPLARASSPVARETFLRILAGLGHAPATALEHAGPLVEDADDGRLLAAHYLARLKATGRPAEHIWPTMLKRIWAVADGPQRREVLRILTVLLRQQRATAAAFLHGLPAQDLPRCTPAPQLTTLMRHLHEAGEAVPDGSRRATAASPKHPVAAMIEAMLDDGFVRLGAPLEHALATLAELGATWPDRYGDLCRGVPARVAAIPGKVPKDVDKIIALAAACWAAVQVHEGTADTLRALRACLSELADGALPVAPHPVVLHGVAKTLCDPGVRIAPPALREALALAAASAPAGDTRKVIARYFLRPLLMAGEAPAGRAAREWCRAQTSHERVGQVPQPPATTLVLTALAQRMPAAVVAASLPDDRRSAKPRATTLLPWTTAPWDPELTVAAAAGGHHLATHALDRLTGVTPGPEAAREVSEKERESEEGHTEDRVGDDRAPETGTETSTEKNTERGTGKRRSRGRQARKRLPSPREEVVVRVPEAPDLLLPWLLEDARLRSSSDALIAFVHAHEARQLPAEHTRQLSLIASHLREQRKDPLAWAAAHRLTARMISRGLTPLGTPADVAEQLDALRTSAGAQTALLEAATQAITADPAQWDLSAARTTLTPVLAELVARASEIAATVTRPQKGHDAYMLAGNAAHLLRVRLAVLDARRRLADGSRDIGLEVLRSLVFVPGNPCVPRGHRLAEPANVWPHRFQTMPRLCIDLHEAGRPQDAEELLGSAVEVVTAGSGPHARWRQFAWNPWRPYLRVLVGERSNLYDLLIDYGTRDHQLGRHLLEVAGQALSNISEELHRLLTDPRWPAGLRDAARRTASWAGRDGANLRWETVYDEIEKR